MFGQTVHTVWSRVGLNRLTGPIFEKELRVSSRRRRNYAVRTSYIILLGAFITVVWLSVVRYQGTVTYMQSRMASAGKEIIATVVFFQFITTQILAIIMLSTAISDEVYHRTLGLLMTTPITSIQVVMGKILSKLLQLILLLAITLPILAVVRVFGGVAWGYLFSSLCITLTAVIFAGSVSLLSSVNSRRAYAVIIRTTFVLGSLYVALPVILGTMTGVFNPVFGGRSGGSSFPWGLKALIHANPLYAMWQETMQMLSPGSGMLPLWWPVHCLVMLGLSVLVLAWAVRISRKVALRQATGQIDGAALDFSRRRRRRSAQRSASVSASNVKRVVGPPVVWKELRAPFIQGMDNRNSYIGLAVTVVALCITYGLAARERVLDESFAHFSYGVLFVMMGIIFSVIFSATRITAERESQTWLLLLATSLSDWDILRDKAVSALWRCLPIWGLLAGHVTLFVLIGYIHPIAIFHLILLVTWVSCFLLGAGLYFSARMTRTTSSVVASFALVVGLWAVLPMLMGFLSLLGSQETPMMSYLWIHPAVQVYAIFQGAGGVTNAGLAIDALEYGTERNSVTFGQITYALTISALVYTALGAAFFWRAKAWLRKNLF